MSLREAWRSSPSEAPESAEQNPGADAGEPSDSGLPRNFLLKAILISLAGIVWIVLGIGKVVVYSVAALLFVAVSMAELALELIAMPVILLLRLLGAAHWPVQINRRGKHFATRYASDLAAATALADEVAGQIEQGRLPSEEPAAAA
jgi:hypothetical protein